MKLALIIFSCLLGVAYSQTVYYNVDEISMPRFRFQFWSSFSQRSAASSIGYNQGSWETMRTNSIEGYSYYTFEDTNDLDDRDLRNVVSNIDVSNLTAVYAEMGFNEESWDCWINHYEWYDWSELELYGIDDVYGALGWNEQNWASGRNTPDSEEKFWNELNSLEKQAAATLCYLPETWNELPFGSFLTTSPYINSIEPWLITSQPTTAPPTTAPPTTAPPTTAPPTTAPPTIAPTKTPTIAPIVPLPPITISPVTIPPADTAPCVGPFCDLCFSAYTTVEMEDGQSAPMKNLRVGDRILAANGKYETIYSFGHFDTSVVKAAFLRIETSTSSGLELTPNHLIFTEGNQAVPAASISVGDKVTMASGEVESVISITTVTRTGIFAPYTPSGTVVTNGIKSSSFATVQGTSPHVSLGGFKIPLTYHQLGVIFESPHRLLCFLSLEQCARYESYNIEGMSQWVEKPMVGFKWLLEQNIIVSGVIFFLSFTFLCMLNLIEMAVVNALFGFSLMMMAFIVSRRYLANKKV